MKHTLLLPVLLISCGMAIAQPQLQYSSQIAAGLSNPIDIVNAGDNTNRLFIVQRGGTIRAYNASLTYLRDFLTVTGVSTTGEGGLLSMAFHPDYETNGYLYVYYTLPDNSLEIARYHVSSNPDSADAASRQVVLNIPHPTNTNHNGGKILFGADGYLYLGTGDGGGGGDVPNNAQNGNILLGKMLRLNVTTTATAPFYTIPPTNPFITDPAVADEIWALGLRNPFRWSFDRGTQDMWLADVGQGAFEEINVQPAAFAGGTNYGWRCYEGNSAYNTTGCLPAASYAAPIFTYGHDNATGGFSVTGGFVYRGPDYPALNGYYICADYVSGNQWVINPNGTGGWNVYQQNDVGFPANMVAYGEAENGTLYAASLTGNTVYKVELAAILPLLLTSFTGKYNAGSTYLDWITTAEKNLGHFDIEYSGDGLQYQYAGRVAAENNADGAAYHFIHNLSIAHRTWYRLKMTDKDGQSRYSNIISVLPEAGSNDVIYPNPVTDGTLRLQLHHAFDELIVMHANGSVVQRAQLNGQTGSVTLPLNKLAQGLYMVHLNGKGLHQVQKLVIR